LKFAFPAAGGEKGLVIGYPLALYPIGR